MAGAKSLSLPWMVDSQLAEQSGGLDLEDDQSMVGLARPPPAGNGGRRPLGFDRFLPEKLLRIASESGQLSSDNPRFDTRWRLLHHTASPTTRNDPNRGSRRPFLPVTIFVLTYKGWLSLDSTKLYPHQLVVVGLKFHFIGKIHRI